MLFSAHALVPNTDDEAKLLFTERTQRSLNLTLIENSDHTRIDKTFWKTDKTGNTYYHIYDNTASKYGLLKIDLSTKEYELFYAGDQGVPEKLAKACGIYLFEVSTDGHYIFMELYLKEKIYKLVCIDTKTHTHTTLLEQKPVSWLVDSLVYSDASQKLYYYTFPEPKRVNNKIGYYDVGLYVFSKGDNESFSADNVKRFFNLPEWLIKDTFNAFINNDAPDYKGYLNWIYYFADKGDDEFAFCVQTKDGQTLLDEEALRYSIDKMLFRYNNSYLQSSVVKLENGKPTDKSALSTIANSSILMPLNEQAIKVQWLFKTDDGIWLFKEHDVQQKQANGTTKSKNEYYTAQQIENKAGDFSVFYNSISNKKIKAACDDSVPTIQTLYGALLYKDYETDKWNVYKNGSNKTCEDYYAAVDEAKPVQAPAKVEPKSPEQKPVPQETKATENTETKQKPVEVTKPSSSQEPPEEVPTKTEQISLEVTQPVTTSELKTEAAEITTPSLNEKKRSLIIITFILAFVCLLELAALIIVLSKKFNTHLHKNDKRLLFSIQEAERTKLSRDIHDSVVQNIRAIRLDAEMLQVMPQSEQKKQHVVDEMTNIITLLRNICYNFRPAELSVETDNTELISIIDTLCQQFISRTKIPCQIQVEKDFVPPKLDTEKSTNIVRVIQEALANIEKHSYATNVQLVIKSQGKDDEKQLVIFVIDDGIGCEVGRLGKDKMKFGIRNMKERIAASGGELEFFSTPNEGLSIQLRIPYKERPGNKL